GRKRDDERYVAELHEDVVALVGTDDEPLDPVERLVAVEEIEEVDDPRELSRPLDAPADLDTAAKRTSTERKTSERAIIESRAFETRGEAFAHACARAVRIAPECPRRELENLRRREVRVRLRLDEDVQAISIRSRPRTRFRERLAEKLIVRAQEGESPDRDPCEQGEAPFASVHRSASTTTGLSPRGDLDPGARRSPPDDVRLLLSRSARGSALE